MSYDYSSMIKAANTTYADTIKGYQSTLADVQSKQAEINQGYGALQSDVLGGIAGQNTQALADARTRYAQANAKMQQGMINRGLSGSTVPVSLGRGLLNDLGAEERRINSDYSGQVANMKSQLGLAGLGYRGTALGQQQAINLAQAGFMGSYAQQQNQLGLGFAGIANQERGQDINAQIARENMANQQKLAQMENAARVQAASSGRSGGGGGGGGGSSYGGGANLNKWSGGGSGGGYGSMPAAYMQGYIGNPLQGMAHTTTTYPMSDYYNPYSTSSYYESDYG